VLAAADGNDWPSSHRDLTGQRYSPLKQITPANVATLETAWSFDTEAGPLQTIPIVAGGVMYLTGGRNVFAIEPETGKAALEVHRAEPGQPPRRRLTGKGTARSPARIFTGAGDRLIALDAKTGEAGHRGSPTTGRSISPAGIKGDVAGEHQPRVAADDLQEHDHRRRQQRRAAAQPRVVRRHPRVGRENRHAAVDVPHRAARGRARRRHVGRRQLEEPIGTNMWSYFTIDEQRGLLFAPIGSPTSDYYGGDRKGKNLYGNSVVALDVNTGS
jgi:quinoprotein glucose dehydrogenase